MSEAIPRWNLPEVSFLETSPEEIKSSVITRYETASGRVLAQGDPVRLFLLTIAEEIIELRSAVNHAAQQNLLSYAQGEYLDALGVLLSVTRLPASAAVTTLRFTLSQALANAFVIPAAFEVTNGVVTFATDEILTIEPGKLTGEVLAHCTETGAVGNDYLAGQVSTIVTPKTFLESATNTVRTAGGSDIESDEDYAERIRSVPNTFSVAGPYKAYEHHTLSVSSAIIDVSVYSPSPGVVNIYPLVSGGALPTSAILTEVENYLNDETIRPLTDEVHAYAPAVKEYAICVDYRILKSDANKVASIQQKVAAAVENYRVWQQSKIGRDIEPNKLISFLEQAGASTIDADTFSPAKFVEVDAYEVAQCTGVTVNYLGLKDE